MTHYFQVYHVRLSPSVALTSPVIFSWPGGNYMVSFYNPCCLTKKNTSAHWHMLQVVRIVTLCDNDRVCAFQEYCKLKKTWASCQCKLSKSKVYNHFSLECNFTHNNWLLSNNCNEYRVTFWSAVSMGTTVNIRRLWSHYYLTIWQSLLTEND